MPTLPPIEDQPTPAEPVNQIQPYKRMLETPRISLRYDRRSVFREDILKIVEALNYTIKAVIAARSIQLGVRPTVVRITISSSADHTHTHGSILSLLYETSRYLHSYAGRANIGNLLTIPNPPEVIQPIYHDLNGHLARTVIRIAKAF